MKKKSEIPFKFSNDGFILLDIVFLFYNNYNEIKSEKFTFVFDTGCNSTVINTKFAARLNFEINKKTSKSKIRTASKVETTYKYISPLVEMPEIAYKIENFEVQFFDVLVDEEEYAGYLGLDFFKGRKFCVDLDSQIISLE